MQLKKLSPIAVACVLAVRAMTAATACHAQQASMTTYGTVTETQTSTSDSARTQTYTSDARQHGLSAYVPTDQPALVPNADSSSTSDR